MISRRALFFCGHQSRYGLAHLEPILQSNLDVVAVVLADNHRWSRFRESLTGAAGWAKALSWPERIRGLLDSLILKIRRMRLETGIERLCRDRAVPIWRVHDANDTRFLQRAKTEGIDWVISAAYPQIFEPALLDLPKYGCVNFHPSLLPLFRGAHPHFWAVATGASETGVTAHLMTERIDDGEIIASLSFRIDGLTYQQVYDAIVEKTPALVSKVSDFCHADTVTTTPQDAKAATYFRNDRDIHHRIFWEQLSAQEIVNLVRTGTAFCFFDRERISVLNAFSSEANRNLTNGVKVTPGAIIDFCDDTIVVKAIDGCVNVRRLADRRRSYRPQEWATKMKVTLGEQFS